MHETQTVMLTRRDLDRLHRGEKVTLIGLVLAPALDLQLAAEMRKAQAAPPEPWLPGFEPQPQLQQQMGG